MSNQNRRIKPSFYPDKDEVWELFGGSARYGNSPAQKKQLLPAVSERSFHQSGRRFTPQEGNIQPLDLEGRVRELEIQLMELKTEAKRKKVLELPEQSQFNRSLENPRVNETANKVNMLQEAMKVVTNSTKTALDQMQSHMNSLNKKLEELQLKDNANKKELASLNDQLYQQRGGLIADTQSFIAKEVGRNDDIVQSLILKINELQNGLKISQNTLDDRIQGVRDEIYQNMLAERRNQVKNEEQQQQKQRSTKDQMEIMYRNIENRVNEEAEQRSRTEKDYQHHVESRIQSVYTYLQSEEQQMSERDRSLLNLMQEGIQTLHQLINKSKDTTNGQISKMQQMLNDNIKDIAYTIEIIKEGLSGRLNHLEQVVMEEGGNRDILKKKFQRDIQQVAGKLDDEVTKMGNNVQNLENHLKQMMLDLQKRVDQNQEAVDSWQQLNEKGVAGELKYLKEKLIEQEKFVKQIDRKFVDKDENLQKQLNQLEGKIYQEIEQINTNHSNNIILFDSKLGKLNKDLYDSTQGKFDSLRDQLDKKYANIFQNESVLMRNGLRDLNDQLQDQIRKLLQNLTSIDSKFESRLANSGQQYDSLYKIIKDIQLNSNANLHRTVSNFEQRIGQLELDRKQKLREGQQQAPQQQQIENQIKTFQTAFQQAQEPMFNRMNEIDQENKQTSTKIIQLEYNLGEIQSLKNKIDDLNNRIRNMKKKPGVYNSEPATLIQPDAIDVQIIPEQVDLDSINNRVKQVEDQSQRFDQVLKQIIDMINSGNKESFAPVVIKDEGIQQELRDLAQKVTQLWNSAPQQGNQSVVYQDNNLQELQRQINDLYQKLQNLGNYTVNNTYQQMPQNQIIQQHPNLYNNQNMQQPQNNPILNQPNTPKFQQFNQPPQQSKQIQPVDTLQLSDDAKLSQETSKNHSRQPSDRVISLQQLEGLHNEADDSADLWNFKPMLQQLSALDLSKDNIQNDGLNKSRDNTVPPAVQINNQQTNNAQNPPVTYQQNGQPFTQQANIADNQQFNQQPFDQQTFTQQPNQMVTVIPQDQQPYNYYPNNQGNPQNNYQQINQQPNNQQIVQQPNSSPFNQQPDNQQINPQQNYQQPNNQQVYQQPNNQQNFQQPYPQQINQQATDLQPVYQYINNTAMEIIYIIEANECIDRIISLIEYKKPYKANPISSDDQQKQDIVQHYQQQGTQIDCKPIFNLIDINRDKVNNRIYKVEDQLLKANKQLEYYMRCYVEASHCIDKTLDIIENRDLTRKVGILNRNMVTLNQNMELVAKSNAQNINKVQKEITDIIKNKILEIVRNKEMKDILKVAISDVINKPDN